MASIDPRPQTAPVRQASWSIARARLQWCDGCPALIRVGDPILKVALMGQSGDLGLRFCHDCAVKRFSKRVPGFWQV